MTLYLFVMFFFNFILKEVITVGLDIIINFIENEPRDNL